MQVLRQKLIEGFLTELRTKNRSPWFSELLDGIYDDILVSDCYREAVSIYEDQQTLLVANVERLVGTEDSADCNLFQCVVSGMSMKDAGIYDGNILIIETCDTANDCEIIIASINGKHFVKRYRIIDGEEWLYSENIDFSPVKIRAEMDFEICGKVIKIEIN